MTTITLDWEADGTPKKDGRQAWRAEQYDPHVVATLRPEQGAFGPYYDLHLSIGQLEINLECHCEEAGRLFAQGWLDVLPLWQAQCDLLMALKQREIVTQLDDAQAAPPHAD